MRVDHFIATRLAFKRGPWERTATNRVGPRAVEVLCTRRYSKAPKRREPAEGKAGRVEPCPSPTQMPRGVLYIERCFQGKTATKNRAAMMPTYAFRPYKPISKSPRPISTPPPETLPHPTPLL